MHQVFIGRQPIYDRNLELYAYELLFRRNDTANLAGDLDDDLATAQVVINAFLEFGLDQIVGQHPAFINLPRKFIVGDIPLPFSKDQVVLEILEDVEVDHQVITAVKKLRADGYTVALDDFVYHSSLRPLVETSQIVKMDLLALPRGAIREHVAELRKFPIKLLAEKVETPEDFDFAQELGFDYFQGYFFCRPKVISGNSLPANRLSILRLLAKLQEPHVNIAELAEIVSHDVAISYKLMRSLNSALYQLSKPIDSIHRAIVYLGLQNVKNWVSLIAMADIPDKPQELMVVALTRAKMCEQLSKMTGLPKETHFTVGLFSALDAMMDAPLERIVKALPLSEEIKQALLHQEGPAGEALHCTLAYERGQWEEIRCPEPETGFLTQAYLEAIRWADEVTSKIQA